MLFNKRNKIGNKISNQVWVGILNYKNTDIVCENLAIPYNLLTNIRYETCNKLVGLADQVNNTDNSSYLIGTYKGEDYIITTPIKILERKIWSPYKSNILKKGIKLQFKGRLKGVSKANSFKISVGNVRTHTYDNMIDYCEKPLQTKWGIFGLKIFLN